MANTMAGLAAARLGGERQNLIWKRYSHASV